LAMSERFVDCKICIVVLKKNNKEFNE